MLGCSFQKSQKLEAAFTFWHFKPNIMIKCRVECQSLTNPKSHKLLLNSLQCDWQLKRKLLERNLTKNLNLFYLSLWGNSTRKFWFISRWMCHQKFMPKIAASMILLLHSSHHTGNETQLWPLTQKRTLTASHFRTEICSQAVSHPFRKNLHPFEQLGRSV